MLQESESLLESRLIMNKKFEIGMKVTIDLLCACGWVIDSYDGKTASVTYLSPDGRFNAVFQDGNDRGIIGLNK